MEVTAGLCLTGVFSLFFFTLNENNYHKKMRFNQNLKRNLMIVNSKDNISKIKDYTPIYISTQVKSSRIVDENLNIFFDDAISVNREVSMYQIKEKENKNESKDSNQNDSSNKKEKEEMKYIWSQFYQKGRDNPHFPFETKRFITDKVTLGPFIFNKEFIREHFVNFSHRKYNLSKNECEYIPISWASYELQENRKTNYNSFIHEFWKSKVKTIHDGNLLFFENIKKDNVGDLKISFSVNSPTHITILGAKYNNTIVPYCNENISQIYISDKDVPANKILNEMESQASLNYTVNNFFILLFMCGGTYFSFSLLK